MSKQHSVSRAVLVVGMILMLTQLAAAQAKPKSKEATMSQFMNPAGLSKPQGFTQVVVSQPGKLVYVSGQVPVNANGDIVAKGDFRAQVTQVMENIKTALAEAGATMNDLIKLNYYVVNMKEDQVAVIREVRSKYLSADHPPASTLVGVTALAREGYTLEIEGIAALK